MHVRKVFLNTTTKYLAAWLVCFRSAYVTDKRVRKPTKRPVSHLRCQSAGGMQQPFTQSSTLCLQADGIKGAPLLIRKAKKAI